MITPSNRAIRVENTTCGCTLVRRATWIGSFISILAGCTATQIPEAPPPDAERLAEKQIRLAMDMERQYLTKLHQLAWPIFRSNTELCGSRLGHALGIVWTKPNSFFKSSGWKITYRNVRSSKAQLSELLPADKRTSGAVVVLAVIPNSPADQAGIQAGDTILRVGGPETTHSLTPSMGIISGWPETREDVSALLSVRRGKDLHSFSITPEEVCQATLNVELTTFAHAVWGEKEDREITCTSVAIDSLSAIHPSYLQFAITHQLARIVSHAAPEQATRTAESEDSDAIDLEADYVALYMLARAGVELEAVKNFYLRRAIEIPRSNVSSTFSPEVLKQHLNLMSAWKEIQQKIENGLPLLPEQERNSS